MLTVQELGLSILGDQPKPFYFIAGDEYGVIEKYIDTLAAHYSKKVEHEKVVDVIKMMSGSHLIPMDPQLYIVRYDSQFASSFDDKVAAKIKKCKMIGTLICTFSTPDSLKKIDKYLPEYTGVVSGIDPKFMSKHLHKDFPGLDDRSISIAVKYAGSYSKARSMCKSMSFADAEELARLSENEIASMFGCTVTADEKALSVLFAARDSAKLIRALEKYEGDMNAVHYTFLNTLLEIEKIKSSKYSNSDLRQFAQAWTIPDIYYTFSTVYSEIVRMRSGLWSDPASSATYIAGLIAFSPVPNEEVL